MNIGSLSSYAIDDDSSYNDIEPLNGDEPMDDLPEQGVHNSARPASSSSADNDALMDRIAFRLISNAAEERLTKAKNCFIHHLNSVDLHAAGGSKKKIQILTPDVHLVDKCWPLFRDFVKSHLCQAYRRKATDAERGFYHIDRKGPAFYILVDFTQEAVERLKTHPVSAIPSSDETSWEFKTLTGESSTQPRPASAGKGLKEKEQRKAANPSKPKKNQSAYILYCSEKREELKEEHPDASFTDLGKRLGDAWNAESDDFKQLYVLKAEGLKSSSGVTDKRKQQDPGDDESDAPSKKMLFDPSTPKPKQIASAYILFCNDKRDEVRQAHPEAAFGRIGAMLGELWNRTPQVIREEYKRRSDAEKERVSRDPSLRPFHTEKTVMERMRHKKASDPNKQKKAVSAYIVYCHEKRDEMKLLHPEASFGQIGKMLGDAWNQLPSLQKDHYRNIAASSRETGLGGAAGGAAVTQLV